MRSIYISITLIAFVLHLSFSRAGSDDLRNEVLKYTNEFRKSKKLQNLQMKDELNALAEKHSKDMASGKIGFGHDGFSDRAKQVRSTLNDFQVAENVAFGVTTGKDAVQLWKNSEGHRANMLGKFKYIGIGVATSSKTGTVYFTQIFAD